LQRGEESVQGNEKSVQRGEVTLHGHAKRFQRGEESVQGNEKSVQRGEVRSIGRAETVQGNEEVLTESESDAMEDEKDAQKNEKDAQPKSWMRTAVRQMRSGSALEMLPEPQRQGDDRERRIGDSSRRKD
jgi:hypothetical protein